MRQNAVATQVSQLRLEALIINPTVTNRDDPLNPRDEGSSNGRALTRDELEEHVRHRTQELAEALHGLAA